MVRISGLFCGRCRKIVPWAKFDADFKFQPVKQLWERTWTCRNCGTICKIETVNEKDRKL